MSSQLSLVKGEGISFNIDFKVYRCAKLYYKSNPKRKPFCIPTIDGTATFHDCVFQM